MNISKAEGERILKAQSQANKVSAVTLRKNDSGKQEGGAEGYDFATRI